MNYVLLMMSGKGNRVGLDTPKQFIKVNNKPIFTYSLMKFYENKKIDEIILVTSKEYIDYVSKYIFNLNLKKKPIHVIEGGSERYLSVYKGLCYLVDNTSSYDSNVLIHDAARPNVSDQIISYNLFALKSNRAVLTAIEGDESCLTGIRRDTIHCFNDKIYRAQTPQSFNLIYIKSLYDSIISLDPYPFKDDASIITYFCDPLTIVDGDEQNYKITTIEDLERFKNEQI